MTLTSIWGVWKCPHIYSTSKKQENISSALIARVGTETCILRSLLSQHLTLLSAPLALGLLLWAHFSELFPNEQVSRQALTGTPRCEGDSGESAHGSYRHWARGRQELPALCWEVAAAFRVGELDSREVHIIAHLLWGSLLLSMAWSGHASLCRNSLWCQDNPHGAESGSLASSLRCKCVPLPTSLPCLTQSHGLGFSLPYLFVHPFKRCNMLGRHCRHRSK